MDEKHQKIIQRNHSELLNKCNFHRLLPKLVEKNVFTIEMAKSYEKLDQESKRNILFDLIGRGPKAYDNLISCLRETDQHDLVNCLLGIKGGKRPRNHSYAFISPGNEYPIIGYQSNLNIMTRNEPLKINVVRSANFKDDFSAQTPPYTMRSKNRGAVLIINNKNFNYRPRNGAQVDEDNLQELFRQMGGYDVTLRVDLDSKDLKANIQEYARNPILKQVNVLFVIIMSHGYGKDNESAVQCINGELIFTSWIEQNFYGDRCPGMQNKPKIIIYQICRGESQDHGLNPVETDGSSSMPVRTHSDMLICHSTHQGYKTHRDIDYGAWYIQSICENFMKYSHIYHVEDLLKMVDEDLRNLQADNMGRTMQTANFHNIGFRQCFLNPGIYEENGVLCTYNRADEIEQICL